MKKTILSLMLATTVMLGVSSLKAHAGEIKVEGIGSAPITGYDVRTVRGSQDYIMRDKSLDANYQWTQNRQFDKAIKQSKKRKKQDKKLRGALRANTVSDAQQQALANAVRILIDRTLGANASYNPEVMQKFYDIISQSGTYILSQDYTGEIIDGAYTARGYYVIDETAFKGLLSDLGVAINTQNVRASSVLTLVDEFFTYPSDLNMSVPTKDVTTYHYSRDKKYTEKNDLRYNSSQKSATAVNTWNGAAIAGSTDKTGLKTSGYVDYSDKENEFFQHIVDFQPRTPQIQNVNYTQPALQSAFQTYDIRTIDNDMFRSKYFGNKPITVDKLTNSADMIKYVNFVRKDAKADFLAIGTSVITDGGINPYIGQYVCSGMVAIKVYSTQDGQVIASGTITESATGQTPDQARAAVAGKVGQNLGEVISGKIQDYWKKRMMYGSEYVVLVNGTFTPMERIALNRTLSSVDGIQNVALRTTGANGCEFLVNYKGLEPVGDSIFMTLAESSLAGKFMNYDFNLNGNQIVFTPIKPLTPPVKKIENINYKKPKTK